MKNYSRGITAQEPTNVDACHSVFECLKPTIAGDVLHAKPSCRQKAESTLIESNDYNVTVDDFFKVVLETCTNMSKAYCLAGWDLQQHYLCREPGQCDRVDFIWRLRLRNLRIVHHAEFARARLLNPDGFYDSLHTRILDMATMINYYTKRYSPIMVLFIVINMRTVYKMIHNLGDSAGCALYHQMNTLVLSAILAVIYGPIVTKSVFEWMSCDMHLKNIPFVLLASSFIAELILQGLFLGKQTALILMTSDRAFAFQSPGLYMAMDYRQQFRKSFTYGFFLILLILVVVYSPLAVLDLLELKTFTSLRITFMYQNAMLCVVLLLYAVVENHYTRKLLSFVRAIPVSTAPNLLAAIEKQKSMTKLCMSMMYLNSITLILYLVVFAGFFVNEVLMYFGFLYDFETDEENFKRSTNFQLFIYVTPYVFRQLYTILIPVNCVIMFLLNVSYVPSYRKAFKIDCKNLLLCVACKKSGAIHPTMAHRNSNMENRDL